MYLNNTLFRTAQLWPDRLAIDTTERQATWSETLIRVRRLADALTTLTRGPAGRIALLGLNSAEYVELTLAVPLTRRPLVTMNYRLTFPEQLHMLSECPCDVICFDSAMRDTAAALRAAVDAKFVFWGPEADRPGYARAYEELVCSGLPVDPVPLSPSDVWAVVPSGGTTGMPKSVELSHGAMAFNVASTLQVLDLGPDPRGLHVAPLFHLAGFACSYALTGTGGTHAFLPSFSVPALLEGLERHRSTVTNLVPTMINWLVASDDIRRHDLSALRNILYGASSISPATLRKLLALFPAIRLNQFYGQTEASGALACLLPEDHRADDARARRLRSAGRPLRGVHVELLDVDGVAVPRGDSGEICARTDALFNRYVGQPVATAEAKRGDWLHTGDVGYMDPDGFLYVTDRLKDMIVTGGENVSASEVENVIAQHPAVVQVAVVAEPDPMWGERVHAFVVTASGVPITPDEIEAHCRKLLASYKLPRGITLRTEPLPLSGAGKVRKDLLRLALRGGSDAVQAQPV